MRAQRPPIFTCENEIIIDHPSALIADDEQHLVDYLENQLRRAWPELRVVAKVANGIEALRLIDELAPDIAFLDIRMPGLTGLEIAARLEDTHAPHLVFITAYDQYAVDAFEHAAVDYLLKPPSDERLAKTVAKLKLALCSAPSVGPDQALQNLLQQLSGRLALPSTVQPAALQWIRAALGKETRLIPIQEVVYFQCNDKYTSVFTADGESLIRTPMRELREQLDSNLFWQIHRSTVVAAKYIAGTKIDFRGRLMVKLKGRTEQLVVSRNYVDLFKQM
ncbi:MAG: LytTR family DNA-binding domain-containing protein [Sideroxyarcus sp.]|nr:LytTR family DNA-binding domain-containing protein [Sideroxyarcus sp.]